MKQSSKTIRLAQMAMLAAISVILVAFVRIPLVPAAPFLGVRYGGRPRFDRNPPVRPCPRYDHSAGGIGYPGVLFSSDGWVGLLMHFVASGALVVLTGWLYHRKNG